MSKSLGNVINPDEVVDQYGADTMRRAVEALDEAGFADLTLCPETMGKVGQLGTLDEVDVYKRQHRGRRP